MTTSPLVSVCLVSSDALVRLRERYTVVERASGVPIPDDLLPNLHAMISTPYDQIDSAFLQRTPRMKIIAQFGTGTDNIDLEAAKARGVTVTHTHDIVTSATADMTLALMLSVTRRLNDAARILDEGPAAMPLGFDLTGKILGIVGMGQIGAAVARRALGFGMKIRYANRSRANPTIERETTASRLSPRDLFIASDVITVHCDLNADSHHLINSDALDCMKDTAVLINTSRAAVVDEVALEHALTQNRLWGAGLDVFSSQLPDAVRHHPRVVLTPHAGTATQETRMAMSNMVVDSIIACLSGHAEIPHLKA